MKSPRRMALLLSCFLIIGMVIGATTVSVWDNQYGRTIDLRSKYTVNVKIIGCHADGTMFYSSETHNLITNAGVTFLQTQASGTSTSTPAKYVALSSNTGGSAYTHTTLAAEITDGNGLARAIGAYNPGSAANGDITWTITKTFTATGSYTAVQLAGLFTADASGTLFAETTFAAVNLENSDTLAVTWSVSVTN